MLIVGLNHTLYVSLEEQRGRQAEGRGQRGGKGGLLALLHYFRDHWSVLMGRLMEFIDGFMRN